jgi:hypothetical protein
MEGLAVVEGVRVGASDEDGVNTGFAVIVARRGERHRDTEWTTPPVQRALCRSGLPQL